MDLLEMKYQLTILDKAIGSLEYAISQDDRSELIRDAIIQRFEYCVELSWKTVKKYLQYKGEAPGAFAKENIKLLSEKKILKHTDIWIDFIDLRNVLSHIYDLDESQEAYHYIVLHYEVFRELYTDLLSSLAHD